MCHVLMQQKNYPVGYLKQMRNTEVLLLSLFLTITRLGLFNTALVNG